jgi:excisionase family DNA binding protein
MGTEREGQVSGQEEAQIWLVTKEAAARARVGPKTVFREVHAGRLKAARVGGRRELRFRPAWVDQWLEERSTPVVINSRDRMAA